MGMTIDKTIEFFNGLECHTPQAKDARDVVIDTMYKYQKIEKIANDKNINGDLLRMSEIRWVLENGNDD